MRPRPAVLPTPTSSSHLSPLLSRQQLPPLTPLAATLMDCPASVANKRLTTGLSPLDATLTENRGEGGVIVNQHPPELDVWTFRRSDVAAFQRTFHSLFSLFAQRVFHNSFAFTGIRALFLKTAGVYPNNSHSGIPLRVSGRESASDHLPFPHRCILFVSRPAAWLSFGCAWA